MPLHPSRSSVSRTAQRTESQKKVSKQETSMPVSIVADIMYMQTAHLDELLLTLLAAHDLLYTSIWLLLLLLLSYCCCCCRLAPL
jgi:hypothetical protein